MNKSRLLLAALILSLAAAAPVRAAQITPDFYRVWVPWGDCVRVSVGTTQSYSTYEWTYDGVISGHAQSFSSPYYCNPGLWHTSSEDHAIEVYVTQGGSASHDSLPYTVYFEPGTPEYGGCGTEIICEECLNGQVNCQ